jgi:hypothetical protein
VSEQSEQQGRSLEVVVAFLIAIVTVIGAVIAWRAAVADDGAGDADFGGLRAAINLEEARAVNNLNAFEHYAAFADYKRYDALGTALEETAGEAPSEETAREMAEVNDLTVAKQNAFPNKFLNRDGSYGLQRELGEMLADAAKEKDLNPEPQFAEADRLRGKTLQLLLSITVLGVALVLYTLIESVSGRLQQYLLLGAGSLLALAASAYAVFVDVVAR